MRNKRFVIPGDVVHVELPFSEVCMHLKVAGQVKPVEVLEDGVQILNPDGTKFSAPITHGEAGVYRDGDGRLYVYHALTQSEARRRARALSDETGQVHVATTRAALRGEFEGPVVEWVVALGDRVVVG